MHFLSCCLYVVLVYKKAMDTEEILIKILQAVLLPELLFSTST